LVWWHNNLLWRLQVSWTILRLVFDNNTTPHAADPKFPKKSPLCTPFFPLETWIAQSLVRGRLRKLLVLIFGTVIWFLIAIQHLMQQTRNSLKNHLFFPLEAWLAQALVRGRLRQLLVLSFGIVICFSSSMNENLGTVHLAYDFIMFIIIFH